MQTEQRSTTFKPKKLQILNLKEKKVLTVEFVKQSQPLNLPQKDSGSQGRGASKKSVLVSLWFGHASERDRQGSVPTDQN